MEFLVIIGVLLLGAVFSLVAAGCSKDDRHYTDRDRTGSAADDIRLVQSCRELKQLAAKARKESQRG